MCAIMDEISRDRANEAAMEAARRTARLRNLQIAQAMIHDGKLTLEDIAKYSGLAIEEVRLLADGQTA